MHRRQVISDLIRENKWTRGAELGLWDGRTYLWLLENCPELTLIGVDAWKPQGFYKGTDSFGNVWDHKKHEATVRAGAKPFGDRAVIVKSDTVAAAAEVEDGILDFVFVDADHSYEGVWRDIKAWQSKLNERGRMMGHDIDWPEVRRAVFDCCGQYEVLADNVWIVNE